uniref:tRNA (guanine(37)-N1)-methyltransferase n=1 Tax=Parastrongyloides trichosuri TaxID=131310 RepID=A0A0N4ZPB0_PARTI
MNILSPPETVREMTILNKEKFTKRVQLPYIMIPSMSIGRIIGSRVVRSCSVPILKRIKPIMNTEHPEMKLLLLNPDNLNEERENELVEAIRTLCNITPDIMSKEFTFTYDDFDIKSSIRAILPQGIEFSGYSQIGHIAHCNLRENLLPYKYTLGQLILDKVNWCKTVVNKLDTISSEFRFFEMELLAGEKNYITTVVEDKIKYKLDFSRVFWNSRLSNEHKRIIEKLDKNSIVYDGFAGVGPFVLPAAKKGVRKVFGNDLNPESVKWMKENLKINKIDEKLVDISNLDCGEFFKTIVKNDLLSYKDLEYQPSNAHIIMNLPALAVTFLPHLKGLLEGEDYKKYNFNIIVHCHLFVKSSVDVPSSWFSEEASRIVKSNIDIPDLKFLELHNVRNVAGRKEMFCASFELPKDYLFSLSNTTKRRSDNKEEEDIKKIKLS